MVCKEEILTWFKDSDSYKRIDLLCELINMCLPFELRFLGSYVEETGKHSYQELRQQALAANDIDKLDKEPVLKNQTLHDESVRHRMLVNVSLLKSRNYNAANWYSKKILRTDCVEDLMMMKERDELVQNELLLLFTMAARHPAFSFEHKQCYNRILMQLYELRENRCGKGGNMYRYPPGFDYPNLLKNLKGHDNVPFAVPFPMHHPPGLPQYLDYHFKGGWPGMTCGAPAEVPPFPHQPQMPLQPPQPSTSPLVNSPSQSRCGSPLPPLHPPTYSILNAASPTSTMTIPIVNQAHPASFSTSGPAVITNPMATVLPGMAPLPLEPLVPSTNLGQSSQLSPMHAGHGKSGSDSDELNTTLKEESPHKSWIGGNATNLNETAKQLNGLRIGGPQAAFPVPPVTVRTSIADQYPMTLTDESSHYHSSSSSHSSPLQTPPETPSNLAPSTINPPTTPPRSTGSVDKNQRVNGMPNFMAQPFGDTTTQPAFTFATFNPLAPRFFTNSGFRPPVTTVFGQFAPNQPFQGHSAAQPPPAVVDTMAPSYPPHTYSIPYITMMYSSYPPMPPPSNSAPLGGGTSGGGVGGGGPPPARNPPPGCYNCGAPGHLGADCPQQNIDDITQKNTYSVDFSPSNSDSEK